jgi:hypothetical protein
VPEGTVAAPVVESAVMATPLAAGTVIVKFDAVLAASSVTDPPEAAASLI